MTEERERFNQHLADLTTDLILKVVRKSQVMYEKMSQEQRDVVTYQGKHVEDLARAVFAVVVNPRLIRKQVKLDEPLKNHIRFLHSVNRLPHVKESHHEQE